MILLLYCLKAVETSKTKIEALIKSFEKTNNSFFSIVNNSSIYYKIRDFDFRTKLRSFYKITYF